MSVYIEYQFKISPLQPASDILMAELGDAGFESFLETEEGLQAYVQERDWREGMLENVFVLKRPEFDIQYSLKEIPHKNWNANWEASFAPIKIDDRCAVRAPFHQRPEVQYDIVIEPKMSFGTGHHETTHMMLQFILNHDLNENSVLDMGCGTGVLAILAAMKGADPVDAIDIDPWCYLNAKENVKHNKVNRIKVYQGDAGLLGDDQYDVILANINRNILLDDIPVYANNLTENGTLFVSGFYAEDLKGISEKCAESGLEFKKNLEKNRWVAAKYVF